MHYVVLFESKTIYGPTLRVDFVFWAAVITTGGLSRGPRLGLVGGSLNGYGIWTVSGSSGQVAMGHRGSGPFIFEATGDEDIV